MAAKETPRGWTAEIAGRAFPNAGCAAAWAQAVLSRETEQREMLVIDGTEVVLVIATAGDGIVETRRVTT